MIKYLYIRRNSNKENATFISALDSLPETLHLMHDDYAHIQEKLKNEKPNLKPLKSEISDLYWKIEFKGIQGEGMVKAYNVEVNEKTNTFKMENWLTCNQVEIIKCEACGNLTAKLNNEELCNECQAKLWKTFRKCEKNISSMLHKRRKTAEKYRQDDEVKKLDDYLLEFKKLKAHYTEEYNCGKITADEYLNILDTFHRSHRKGS